MHTRVRFAFFVGTLVSGASILILLAFISSLPSLSPSEFVELQSARERALRERELGFGFWRDQPFILAGRTWPAGRAASFLIIANLPALVPAVTLAQPATCRGLPLLRHESFVAFGWLLFFSAVQWLFLGTVAGFIAGLFRHFAVKAGPSAAASAG